MIVYESAKRSNIEHAKATGMVFGDLRQNGKKRGLSFPRSGGRGDNDITLSIENGIDRKRLNFAQIGPPLLINPALYIGVEAVERC